MIDTTDKMLWEAPDLQAVVDWQADLARHFEAACAWVFGASDPAPGGPYTYYRHTGLTGVPVSLTAIAAIKGAMRAKYGPDYDVAHRDNRPENRPHKNWTGAFSSKFHHVDLSKLAPDKKHNWSLATPEANALQNGIMEAVGSADQCRGIGMTYEAVDEGALHGRSRTLVAAKISFHSELGRCHSLYLAGDHDEDDLWLYGLHMGMAVLSYEQQDMVGSALNKLARAYLADLQAHSAQRPATLTSSFSDKGWQTVMVHSKAPQKEKVMVSLFNARPDYQGMG